MFLRPAASLLHFVICLNLSVLAAFGASAQSSPCADGIIRSAKANESIQLCNIVAQQDPKLAAQLDVALKLLGQQQKQIAGLVSAVNTVGKNLDPNRQAKLLQSLVDKLQSTPGAAPQRAEHLTLDLTSLNVDIQTMQTDPASSALTQARLEGPLGDAVAQLDVAEARADLADIRSTLQRIDAQTQHIAATTDATQKDVASINKQMNALLAAADPTRVLPPGEVKLYTDISPLMMACSSLARRWEEADTAVMQATTRQRSTGASPFAQEVANGIAPLAAQYGNDLQPRLEAWRLKLLQRAPSLPSAGEFKPPALNATGNEIVMQRAGGQLAQLLRMYSKADPARSPALIDEGQKLKVDLDALRAKIREVHKVADEAEFERRNAARPVQPQAPPPLNPFERVDPEVDPPFQKELATTLQPRLQAWLQGVAKLVPAPETIDFSLAVNGLAMQQKVCGAFNRNLLPFNEKVIADLRAAAAAAAAR